MPDILYKIIGFLDYIVDSGNMILVQCAFLLLTATLLVVVITLDKVDNNLSHTIFIVSLVPLLIAGELWLYHRIVRDDSFR